jgi:branched-chain amino acid transport system ATP-binding protein
MDQELLRTNNISLSFLRVTALNDVRIEVKEGEILSIIGPNGAGKTSLLNCLNGFYRPQRGDIYFEGKQITHFSSHKIASKGGRCSNI